MTVGKGIRSVMSFGGGNVVDPEFVAALVRVLRGDDAATDDVELSESDGDDEDQDKEQDNHGFATEGARAAAQRRLTALKRLWDMSVDAGVCVLLCELRAVQTLEDLLLEQHAPRTNRMCCPSEQQCYPRLQRGGSAVRDESR